MGPQIRAVAYGTPSPLDVRAALRKRLGIESEVKSASYGRHGACVDLVYREEGRHRLLRWYAPSVVTTDDGRHVHDGVLLCLGASGSAHDVLNALIEEFGGLLETGPDEPWTEAVGNRSSFLDTTEIMTQVIAKAMGWENLPAAIRLAQDLVCDAETRRRFAEALAQAERPFRP